MKLKLSCCELNKQPPIGHWLWECADCECVFRKKRLLEEHNYEVHHKEKPAKKRKMDWWDRNERNRQTLGADPIACHYCECTFGRMYDHESHVKRIHACSECSEILLTDDDRAKHTLRHNQEGQLQALQEQRQCKLDDDFVLNFLYGKKLDECQSEPGHEPDFNYIFNNYNFEKEELVRIVKEFKDEFLGALHTDCDEYLYECAVLIYLVEYDALSIEDMVDLLDCLMFSLGHEEYVSDILAYLLEKDYTIKAVWVSKAIDNNDLIDRIKTKHTFTFDEIHDASDRNSFFNNEQLDEFYVQVHRHFPDPNFKDPFADPYERFKHVQTEHVHDHLMNRYFYKRKKDELSIVVGYDENKRKISLGSCAEMLEKNLEELIEEYEGATQVYDELNDQVSNLFDEREKELDKASKENERLHILDYFHDEIYGAALPKRNYQANIVSKLYFVISMK